MVAILDIRTEPFSNSKSRSCPDAVHRVSATSDLITIDDFQMDALDSDGDVENVKSD